MSSKHPYTQVNGSECAGIVMNDDLWNLVDTFFGTELKDRQHLRQVFPRIPWRSTRKQWIEAIMLRPLPLLLLRNYELRLIVSHGDKDQWRAWCDSYVMQWKTTHPPQQAAVLRGAGPPHRVYAPVLNSGEVTSWRIISIWCHSSVMLAASYGVRIAGIVDMVHVLSWASDGTENPTDFPEVLKDLGDGNHSLVEAMFNRDKLLHWAKAALELNMKERDFYSCWRCRGMLSILIRTKKRAAVATWVDCLERKLPGRMIRWVGPDWHRSVGPLTRWLNESDAFLTEAKKIVDGWTLCYKQSNARDDTGDYDTDRDHPTHILFYKLVTERAQREKDRMEGERIVRGESAKRLKRL
jgi:hypothetical protein